jgi:RNA polymerase sigma factor (sigma-70 family)
VTAETDAELVRRCLQDEADALRALVDRFQSDVFGLCVRILRNAHDAEDVAQEVFVRVFRSLKRWDATRQLRPWILGIAVNRCRTALAKRAKRPDTVDYLHETADRDVADDSRELAGAIRAVVDNLRADYREVFVLFHEGGQSYEEISVAIDRPVGTIKTWLHRARTEVLAYLRRKGLVPTDREGAIEETRR